jgi:tetratricopeptide (TPR) repeat protein
LQAYDAALRDSPGDAYVLRLRGEALLRLHRYAEAEQSFGESLQRAPAAPATYRGRGLARIQLGDFGGAIEDYTHALRSAREADLLAHRGWAYFFTDAWKLAQRDFEDALRLDANRSDAYIGRGLVRLMLGDYRRAVADADEVLRRKAPDEPEMMHNLACLFALASSRVKADAAERERGALEARYRQQALEALRKTLPLVPPPQRLAFWQEKMIPDTALDPIRNAPEFLQLDRQVRQEASQLGRETKKETVPPQH